MLVTFTTDAHANIIMFGDDALPLLRMMGHSGTVPSAIRAEDVPLALSQLKAAVNQATPSNARNNEDEPAVSLAHRALPLINLLTDAAKANCNVMWR